MKKCHPCILMFAFLVLVTLCLAQEGGDEKKASSTTIAAHGSHEVVRPEDVKWGAASPKLPPGAQFAVLLGDPSKPGAPYVFRARLPDGYSVAPHWHPMDENVTVISGVFRVGLGDKFDEHALRDLPAGSYAMLPSGLPHYNRIKGETVLQFHGTGPYDINYVNPADDPSKKPTDR
jgi:hypothetical protein